MKRTTDAPAVLDTGQRAGLIACTIALHVICYISVNRINARLPASGLRDFSIALDARIPYLGWTALVYYYGVPFMSLWACAVVWLLPGRLFLPAIRAYAGMILTGALVQILLPGHSPWPAAPVGFQQFMHLRVSYDPYVCLPSMHVALCVLPACLSLHSFRGAGLKAASILSALFIGISTVTLKEHYLLDSVAGAVLALAAYACVRRHAAPSAANWLGQARDV